jgi:hypothetical protein
VLDSSFFKRLYRFGLFLVTRDVAPLADATGSVTSVDMTVVSCIISVFVMTISGTATEVSGGTTTASVGSDVPSVFTIPQGSTTPPLLTLFVELLPPFVPLERSEFDTISTIEVDIIPLCPTSTVG